VPSDDGLNGTFQDITSLGGSCREDFDAGNFIQYPLRVMGMELPVIRRKG